MAVALPFNFGRGLSKITLIKDLLDDTAELAFGYLRLTGVTADGNTIVIGTDTVEVDTLTAAGTALGAVGLPDQAADTTYTFDAAHGLAVGQVIKCETEIMLVKAVLSTVKVVLGRARSGTTKAAHAGTTGTFKSAVTAGRIPLGVLSTSAANFCTAFIAEVNAGDRGNVLGSVKAVAFGTTSVAVVAKKRGVSALATVAVLANGAFDAATLGGGLAPSRRRVFTGSRVPTAAEVTAGIIIIPCAFSPTAAVIQVITTSGGALVAHGGKVEVVPASGAVPGYVRLTNNGTVDWSAAMTINYAIAC